MWPSKKNKELVERVVLRTGDVINRRYKINKVLGEGSFGTVYKVDDLRLQQASALKVLRLYDVPPDNRPELCDRFRKEYSTGRINCNCLVHSLEYREIKGNPYIVMEFCPGGDLNPYLGNADGQAVSICYDLLTGLNALHTHGIVHRDLKPENILFKSDGHAALTDFGIVGDQNDNMTKIGANLRPKDIFGTHAYMAPEQRNRARWGVTRLATSDMFSFGVLTYQLLTGRLPFGRLDTYDDLPAYVERAEKGQWDKAPLKYIDQGASWQRLINACLQPYFQKVKRNIGTFKAFGMNGRELVLVYVLLLIMMVVAAVVIALLLTWALQGVLPQMGIEKDGFNYLSLWRITTYVATIVIILATVCTVVLVMARMLSQTPGDLIYDR